MKREIKIGLLIIIATSLVYFGLLWVKNQGIFAPNRNFYFAIFNNVNNLKINDPVNINGFQAGKIESISLIHNKVLVKFSLDQNILISKDASVEIQIKEVLSGKQLAINQGINQVYFNPLDTILGKNTFDFAIGLSKLGELFDKFDTTKISKVFNNLDIFSQNLAEVNVKKLTNQLDILTLNLNHTLSKMDKLIDNFQKVNLVEKTDSFILNANSLISQINSTIIEIKPKINYLTDSTFMKIENAVIQLDTLLNKANSWIKLSEKNNTFLYKAFSDTSFSNQLNLIINNFNETLNHIRFKKLRVGVSLSTKQKNFLK